MYMIYVLCILYIYIILEYSAFIFLKVEMFEKEREERTEEEKGGEIRMNSWKSCQGQIHLEYSTKMKTCEQAYLPVSGL